MTTKLRLVESKSPMHGWIVDSCLENRVKVYTLWRMGVFLGKIVKKFMLEVFQSMVKFTKDCINGLNVGTALFWTILIYSQGSPVIWRSYLIRKCKNIKVSGVEYILRRYWVEIKLSKVINIFSKIKYILYFVLLKLTKTLKMNCKNKNFGRLKMRQQN